MLLRRVMSRQQSMDIIDRDLQFKSSSLTYRDFFALPINKQIKTLNSDKY